MISHNKKPAGDATGIGEPASLEQGTAKLAIPSAHLTVATPAQTTPLTEERFAWQLRGPFNAGAQAGFSAPTALCAVALARTTPLLSFYRG